MAAMAELQSYPLSQGPLFLMGTSEFELPAFRLKLIAWLYAQHGQLFFVHYHLSFLFWFLNVFFDKKSRGNISISPLPVPDIGSESADK